MSNLTPATCAIDGHCMHPDDTTDTCMRCGAVDGWIEYKGGGCPVAPWTRVHGKYADGSFHDGAITVAANCAGWDDSLTHYRLASPVVEKTHPALGLEPLTTEPSYEEKLRDQAALVVFKSLLAAPDWENKNFSYAAYDYADSFMTERAKRMAARKAGG